MMIERKYRLNIAAYIAAGVFLLLTLGGLTGCNKNGTASPTGLNTQINILNLSPDVLYLELWTNQIRGTKLYKYPSPSGYTFVNALDNTLQLRRERLNTTIYDATPILKSNTRYSLFVYGLYNNNTNSTLKQIFLADSDAIPAVGKGKVRFINAVSRAATFDVTANGTVAFKAQNMGDVTKYIEMPAGMYHFRFLNTGTTSVITDLPNVTVQDGRFYTIYTYGIIGRTDSARIAASFINNR